jgi:FtsH-binding integral membrane protein
MNWVNIFGTKQTFLFLVFSNLILQLLITRYAITNSPKESEQKIKNNRWYSIGLFVVAFVVLMLMSLPMPIVFKFLLFCVFSTIMGFIIGARDFNETIIQTSFYGTLGIFVLMGLLGLGLNVFGINLGPRFGIGLFMGLLCIILISIFNLITGDISHKLISSAVVLLFSIYILYDTNIILQRNYAGDFISASVAYYLDIINVFNSLNVINDA